MSITSIDIEILGRFIKVNCPNENLKELQCSADDLNVRLKDLKNKTGASNIEQLVFITALNMCREISLEKKNQLKKIDEIKKRIIRIKDNIDDSYKY